VVAQQLFTTVKRGNAIAQNWKTAHRITVSRFFVGSLTASPQPSKQEISLSPALSGGEGERKRKKEK